nr:hypothetical protein Iba_chr04bCG2550 [Ipomoea batatas]
MHFGFIHGHPNVYALIAAAAIHQKEHFRATIGADACRLSPPEIRLVQPKSAPARANEGINFSMPARRHGFVHLLERFNGRPRDLIAAAVLNKVEHGLHGVLDGTHQILPPTNGVQKFPEESLEMAGKDVLPRRLIAGDKMDGLKRVCRLAAETPINAFQKTAVTRVTRDGVLTLAPPPPFTLEKYSLNSVLRDDTFRAFKTNLLVTTSMSCPSGGISTGKFFTGKKDPPLKLNRCNCTLSSPVICKLLVAFAPIKCLERLAHAFINWIVVSLSATLCQTQIPIAAPPHLNKLTWIATNGVLLFPAKSPPQPSGSGPATPR